MRCFQSILQISYIDCVTNNEVCCGIETVTGPFEDLLTTVKNARGGGMAMSANQRALPRPFSKALCWEPEEEEGNVRVGKTTSKNGQVYLSLNHKSLLEIECDCKPL